jgi:hypothetical protein
MSSSTTPQADWKRGEIITADSLNRLKARSITDVRPGPGLTMIRNGNGVSIALDAPILNRNPKPVRMKIKTDADSNGVAVCNTWDGTNLGTEDINVRVFVSFKANQELWAKTVSPNAAVQKDAKDVFYIEDGTKQYQLIPVHLTQTGGVSGTNKTAKCTFTYTVKDVTDTFTLGTGVGLTGWGNGWSNLKLKLTAATKGSGYLDGGTFVLTFVDEAPDGEQDCP